MNFIGKRFQHLHLILRSVGCYEHVGLDVAPVWPLYWLLPGLQVRSSDSSLNSRLSDVRDHHAPMKARGLATHAHLLLSTFRRFVGAQQGEHIETNWLDPIALPGGKGI
jgi:hypothetical protein